MSRSPEVDLTTVVAALALLLSLASLSLQAYTWRAAGPVVSVTVRGAVIGTEQPTLATSVEVTNRGRAAVQVSGVVFEEAVRRPTQQLVVFRQLPFSKLLPFDLAAQSSESCLYAASAVGDLARQHGAERLRAVVRLGNGTAVRSKPFPAPGPGE